MVLGSILIQRLFQAFPNAEIVDVAAGEFARKTAVEAISDAGITTDAALAEMLFPGGEVFSYQARYGSSVIREVSLMVEDNGQTEMMFPSYRVQVRLSDLDVVASVIDANLGGMTSDVYSLEITDSTTNTG